MIDSDPYMPFLSEDEDKTSSDDHVPHTDERFTLRPRAEMGFIWNSPVDVMRYNFSYEMERFIRVGYWMNDTDYNKLRVMGLSVSSVDHLDSALTHLRRVPGIIAAGDTRTIKARSKTINNLFTLPIYTTETELLNTHHAEGPWHLSIRSPITVDYPELDSRENERRRLPAGFIKYVLLTDYISRDQSTVNILKLMYRIYAQNLFTKNNVVNVNHYNDVLIIFTIEDMMRFGYFGGNDEWSMQPNGELAVRWFGRERAYFDNGYKIVVNPIYTIPRYNQRTVCVVPLSRGAKFYESIMDKFPLECQNIMLRFFDGLCRFISIKVSERGVDHVCYHEPTDACDGNTASQHNGVGDGNEMTDVPTLIVSR
ncbi:hypothetical protein ElyMa_004524600 [Elysia marginata]|uniref:Uncharacterized protein n=1 Tax=Elysia marginata TaxID=1093978 RepID=A0AAV4HNM8_9GAST|nr:hypothetical protein ElyMa_004524600 [Elysia marginata]